MFYAFQYEYCQRRCNDIFFSRPAIIIAHSKRLNSKYYNKIEVRNFCVNNILFLFINTFVHLIRVLQIERKKNCIFLFLSWIIHFYQEYECIETDFVLICASENVVMSIQKKFDYAHFSALVIMLQLTIHL